MTTPDEERKSGTGEARNAGGGAQPAEQAHLDKVRDILFGGHVREFEKRLTRLEERLVKVSTDARDDVRKRFDSLETYIKGEVESMAAKLTDERSERVETVKELSRGLKDLTGALERKASQLADHAAKTQRDLRQQLLEQSKTLSDEMQRTQEETHGTLQEAVQELRTEKTDRAMLANLFTEVAMRLTDEFKIPGPDKAHE